MTNQPWQEKLNDILPDAYGLQSVTGHNERRAIFEQLEQFISELLQEEREEIKRNIMADIEKGFTAGYKAGREEILKWAEEKKNKRSYAEMCNLSDYEVAKVNGQDNLLEELQNLINKDEI